MLVKPSIVFDGKAEEAILFYQKVFNGKIENLVRFEQIPTDEAPFLVLDEKYKKRLVNARLSFGNNQFNVSDSFPNQVLNLGNNIALDVVFFDNQPIETIFFALSEEGKVLIPITKTFFTPNFAKIIDKFGVIWNIMQM